MKLAEWSGSLAIMDLRMSYGSSGSTIFQRREDFAGLFIYFNLNKFNNIIYLGHLKYIYIINLYICSSFYSVYEGIFLNFWLSSLSPLLEFDFYFCFCFLSEQVFHPSNLSVFLDILHSFIVLSLSYLTVSKGGQRLISRVYLHTVCFHF